MLSNAISPIGSDSVHDRSRVVLPTGAGITLWLTGLSGSGKTTLAIALAEALDDLDIAHSVLDGDVLRQSLSAGLGYSAVDRRENVRRIAEQASWLASDGKVVIVAAIAPYRDARLAARRRLGSFIEVYVNAPLATCMERDPKGLYARVASGELRHFTGVDDPYEEPVNPEVECRTDVDSVSMCVASILVALMRTLQQPAI